MAIVVIGALAGGIALAVMYGIHSISGQLAAAGAVCYALVLIITLPTNCPHQPSKVYSESTAGTGPSAGATDSVPRLSNFILRSRICRLRPGRDFKYQPVGMKR